MAKSKETTEEKNPLAGFNILDLTNRIKVNDTVEETDEDKPDLAAMENAIRTEQTTQTQTTTQTVDTNEEEEETQEDKPTTKVETTNTTEDEFSLKPFVKMLADKGVVDFEEGEEFKDDEDGIAEIVQKTIDNRRKKDMEELPDDLRKAVDWVKNGGDFKEYINYFFGNVSYSDVKIEGEDAELQKAIVRDFLKSQDESDEDIDSIVDKYEIGGILEDEAKRALKKLQKSEEAEKQKAISEQANKAEEGRKKVKEYWDNVKSTIDKKEEIKGFKLTPKIKEKLWEHINKPIKDGKSQWVLNYQNNLDSQLIAAYLDMVNYDVSKLEKQIETKVTSDLRKKLGKYTDSRNRISSASGRTEINDDAPFEGFKKLKL